jgi:hypothetical protein
MLGVSPPRGGLFNEVVGWMSEHRVAAVTVGLWGLAMAQVAILALQQPLAPAF